LHPKELQQIHDHVKEFAKQQGITEEEAERQLTEETLRGASDDFANVKENQVARAYLNQLQRMEDGQHLFGVLDRNSSEYKNSLINAQYVTPNKDLYNRVNRDSKNYATTTADYVLNAAIREGKRNYQQAGKETVSQVYGHARAEANRYRELERYHSEQESKQDQSLARKYSRQANSLTSAMAENYTSGTGVFSLKELYANKDPLAKTMLENIAESGYATGVGASLRAAGHTQVTPAQVKESASTALKPVIDSAKNYSAKIPEEANANSKLPPVGKTKGYENQDYSKDVANLGVNRNKGLNERISNRQKDHYINEQATKNVHKVTAPIDFDGHILNAEIKGKKVVGGHSIANGNIRVDKVVKAPNANGVYEAKISVRDPNNPGKFLSKTNNNGKSTMFPDSWTSDRIKVEVDYAYKNRVPHPDPLKASKGMWQGVTKSGVKVEGYVSPKTTVYPLM